MEEFLKADFFEELYGSIKSTDTEKYLKKFLFNYLKDLVINSGFDLFKKLGDLVDEDIFDFTDKKSLNLVHYSCLYQEDIRFLDYLISKKTNINSFNSEKGTPSFICFEKGKFSFFEKLLENGANPDQLYNAENNTTVFHHCVDNNMMGYVKLMLRYGANPVVKKITEVVDYKKITEDTFALVCKKNNFEILELLLKTKYYKSKKFNNLVFICVNYGSLRCLKLILTPENVNILNKNNETPLNRSIFRRKNSIAFFLLRNGGSITKKNKWDCYPLDYVTKNTDERLIDSILDKYEELKKSNVSIENSFITSNFVNLISQGIPNRACKRFLELFSDIIITPDELIGNKTLFSASQTNNYEIVKLLIKKGININITDFYNENCLMKYVKYCKEMKMEMCDLLLLNKARIDIPNHLQKNVMEIALENKNIELVYKLLMHGEKIDLEKMCSECDELNIDHIEDETDKARIIEKNSQHHLSLCLEMDKMDIFKFNINNCDKFYNSVDFKILKKCSLYKKEINSFLVPWRPSTNYLYSKKQRDLARLMMFIQKRLSQSEIYNYDIFMLILRELIIFESKILY